MPDYPVIPAQIVVHIGAPGSSGLNVTEPFASYIKNVASSEIYPTWPEESIRANVLAQISVALNRVYTEYYPSRGYAFDITSSPAYDQNYVYQRDIFENVSTIVDDIFDSYLRKIGFVEPLFAQFCDGVEVACTGLAQWGTVELAKQGATAEEIIKEYYGNDVEIVYNAPVEDVVLSAPPTPLGEGDSGRDVELAQRRLNRISSNFPGIPKITPADVFFEAGTTAAIRKFQEIFGIRVDGLIGKETWNQILLIYNGVKRVSALNSEGIRLAELQTEYPGELKRGDASRDVRVIQYYLAYIAAFVPSVRDVRQDGAFGTETEQSVISFQRTYGMTETGVVNRLVWDKMQNVYYGLVSSLEFTYRPGEILPFPGRILRVGLQGDDVRVLQGYLNYISDVYPAIPRLTQDGIFGPQTQAAVIAFQDTFGLSASSEGRVNVVVWNAIVSVYEDLYVGSAVDDAQFPGYTIS